MLPNLSNKLTYKDVDFDISKKFINKKIVITRNKKFTLNDRVIEFLGAVCKKDFYKIEKYKDIFQLLRLKEVPSEENLNLLVGRDFVNQKKAFKVDLDYIEDYFNDYVFNVLPKRDKINDLISDAEYTHTKIKTGRYSILSGIKYTHLSHDQKKNLKPKNKQNYLIEVDIKSCEPGLLYKILYTKDYVDIYREIEAHFSTKIERKKIKLATIATLYGASIEKAKKISGITSQEVKIIRSLFKIDKLNRFLLEKFDKDKCIFNMYGRPILEKGPLLNYWLQSSAADFASLAFLSLANNNKDIKLNALIHDAAIFELSDLNSFANENKVIVEPMSNLSLPINLNVLFKPA